MTNVFEGKFGKEEEDKPTAVKCLEEFLERITRPAVEEGIHSAVDAVVIQLDDFGVSVGSNSEDTAHLIMLLELAKLSLLDQYMGEQFGMGGQDDTVH